MQTLNPTNQGIAKGTTLHVVNEVRGYRPNRSDVAPSKDIHKQWIFPQIKEAKFMSSSQLESPQSEVKNLRYRLNKMAMSAVLKNSECSTNSYVSPWIQNEYC
jgi:hypothetical protein